MSLANRTRQFRKCIPWNKGWIGCFSPTTLMKMSKARRKRITSEVTRQRLSESHQGEKNSFFGKTHSKETRLKLAKCQQGRTPSQDAKEKMRLSHLGQFTGEKHPMFGRNHSEATKLKWAKDRIGGGNSNWHGGISFFPYPPTFNGSLKKMIRERDVNRCQNPCCEGNPCPLTTHHIDYDKENCHPLNLITLCKSCNSKANGNREKWKELYQMIIRNRTSKHFMRMAA